MIAKINENYEKELKRLDKEAARLNIIKGKLEAKATILAKTNAELESTNAAIENCAARKTFVKEQLATLATTQKPQ